uniref:Uncharacterized protein n=1 Tax=Anguilla anguilla TaxID=7936 RepID=A0A0E9WP42_ANGAN
MASIIKPRGCQKHLQLDHLSLSLWKTRKTEISKVSKHNSLSKPDQEVNNHSNAP